ncbi:MAG: hypothetical protein CVT80_00265 [Alphaproteobacteria bacterium HGW-Alphaproteobacteria-2]|nr:MAG: hypothetical protein CVT80_00265 [Alphaproteobacteria bacterium HGW-Alphaproteobacteria-2]
MRCTDWHARLTAFLARAARSEFRPGDLDCALFAAGAVEAVTGLDPAASLRGRYATLDDGYARLAALGFADHVALAQSLFAEVPPAMAWPGDLAEVETAEGPALGVVQGQCVYVMGRRGMGLMPLSAARRTFRVD